PPAPPYPGPVPHDDPSLPAPPAPLAPRADDPGDRAFSAPRIAINRVYTRHGDGGLTRLVGGQQLPKDDLRIECYGTVDELNAFVGLARQTLLEALPAAPPDHRARLDALARSLFRVQHELFNLGSILATLPEDVHPKQPRVTPTEVERLEAEMDRAQEDLAPLRSFVLPGGARLNADLHVARTVCRRAERLCVALSRAGGADAPSVAYLNRLSDALFVWSRWASFLLGAPEVLWEPEVSATGEAAREKKAEG
ncbi:MAG TPA: cob(I)yrinic acid a,c-diamide adenosyltransferase, partial [Candidatus Nanopelagicales bacterium]|nr:cob(I)yrinic acid a,c-diamide adenosyltransferase [Candidatus Nanopelagicales bacterium]